MATRAGSSISRQTFLTSLKGADVPANAFSLFLQASARTKNSPLTGLGGIRRAAVTKKLWDKLTAAQKQDLAAAAKTITFHPRTERKLGVTRKRWEAFRAKMKPLLREGLSPKEEKKILQHWMKQSLFQRRMRNFLYRSKGGRKPKTSQLQGRRRIC